MVIGVENWLLYDGDHCLRFDCLFKLWFQSANVVAEVITLTRLTLSTKVIRYAIFFGRFSFQFLVMLVTSSFPGGHKESISSTLYVRISRTNVIFSSYMYIEKRRLYKKNLAFNVDEIDGRYVGKQLKVRSYLWTSLYPAWPKIRPLVFRDLNISQNLTNKLVKNTKIGQKWPQTVVNFGRIFGLIRSRFRFQNKVHLNFCYGIFGKIPWGIIY